jgi:hypothetical protein
MNPNTLQNLIETRKLNSDIIVFLDRLYTFEPSRLDYVNPEKNGNTPLITAIIANNTIIVKKLLELNATGILTNNDGKTALMVACTIPVPNLEIINMLLERKDVLQNIHLRNEKVGSVLHQCIAEGVNKDIIDLLIYKGATDHPRIGEPSTEEKSKSTVGGKRVQTRRRSNMRKSRCNLVIRKRKTCCIRPKKGHGCSSKRRISRKMKGNCSR